MGAGMLGFLGNMIPTLPDFFGAGMNEGIRNLTGGDATSKARKNFIHDTRTLRRKEYQDMVFSLKKAGLNPILAVGASPGHASAQQQMQPQWHGSGSGAGGGYASAKQAEVAAGKAPSEISKNFAGTGLMQDQAAGQQIMNLQMFERNRAEIDNVYQNTRTNLALQEKYKQDAITGGASASKINKDIEMLDKFGPPGQSWESMIRAYLPGPEKAGNSAKSAMDWGKGKLDHLPDYGQQLRDWWNK